MPNLVLEIQLGVPEIMIFVQGHGRLLFPHLCSCLEEEEGGGGGGGLYLSLFEQLSSKKAPKLGFPWL